MTRKLYEVDGLCVDVKYLVMGGIDNNVYIISDDKATMVVDPTCEPDVILQALEGAPLDTIILTHEHYDHIGAAAALREMTGAQVVACEPDVFKIEHPDQSDIDLGGNPCRVDRVVDHGDVVEVGNMKWKIIATPGHTPGSMCLFNIPAFGNHERGLPVLISGDTLFAGTIGRTDFEGGSMEDMRASLKKLAALPDDTAVLPGHYSLTTIGAERRRVFAAYGDK
jgi:glyoxylase-like metal-dependent hydrolase (beta-lactamase superfamily II)